jgi:dTMP kinase
MALMFASRAQHIAEVIEPALKHGSVVLCDRFTDSTEAYQGSGRKLGSDPVLELHRVLCGDLQPDLTILLDSDASSVVSRARRRNKRASRSAGRGHADENRFEQETRAFFARVREGYLQLSGILNCSAKSFPTESQRHREETASFCRFPNPHVSPVAPQSITMASVFSVSLCLRGD